MANYEVVVGNIGMVYSGSNASVARKKFATYVRASKSLGGRASGEDITLFKDDVIIKEWHGNNSVDNPSSILKKLKKGVHGHIKLSKGRLIIKT
jgi:hypothetical protein